MARTATATAFTGFPRAAMQFWYELAAEMDKPWFEANKARYQAEWVAPMTALLATVRPRLARAYRTVALGEPKVLRIHRDVRFSKDKTPYKTHLGAVISLAGASMAEGGAAALYVHLGIDEEIVGVGTYRFGPAQLTAWRAAVAGKPGVELARTVGRLRAAGYQVGGHDDYKKVPRGLDAEHPRAEFLKMKGLTGSAPPIPRGLVHDAAFAAWLVEHATALAPVVTWLARHVAA